MWWTAVALAVAALAVTGRGVQLIVTGRRRRSAADPEQRMVAGLRIVAGVKMLNRGALLLVIALALLLVVA
jgi:hypothetical protein